MSTSTTLKIKDLVLYSYYQSSASWRVRSVLAHKKVPFKYEAINLLAGQQHSDADFAKLNPMHQVPLLKVTYEPDRTDCISQSLAIIQFIEEVYPENSILPEDPVLRAKSRAIAEFITSGIQPLQNLETLVEYGEPVGLGKIGSDKRMEVARYWLKKKFAALERLVKPTAGKYCVGDDLSIADICLVPQMHNAKRFEVDCGPYPTLVAINTRLLELDAIKTAHPLACPDAPKPQQ